VSLSDTVSDVGFGVGWAAIKRMPEPIVDRAFRAIADRTYRKNGIGVRQLRANLARVIPDAGSSTLEATTHEGVRRYMRYWSEAFRLPAWSPEHLRESFDLIEGLEQRSPRARAPSWSAATAAIGTTRVHGRVIATAASPPWWSA
jgi:lauroyl/myristoyl acyltransferase